MTNETKILLNKTDIRDAIYEFVAKKYPTFMPESMYLEYNRNNCEGWIQGKIKEGN